MCDFDDFSKALIAEVMRREGISDEDLAAAEARLQDPAVVQAVARQRSFQEAQSARFAADRAAFAPGLAAIHHEILRKVGDLQGATLTAEQAKTALLAGVAGGQLESIAHLNWRGPIEPEVRCGSWTFQFFIEANWVYDIYCVTAPFGLSRDFPATDDPWDLLTKDEAALVVAALRR